jgi:hypothetical protein
MHEATVGSVDASAARAADELEASGCFLDAAHALEAVPAEERPAADDVRIVHLRHLAYGELQAQPAPPADTLAADVPDLFPGVVGPPEVDGPSLTFELFESALAHHGCVIVRGMIGDEAARHLRDDVDRAFEAFDRMVAGEALEQTAPWYRPMKPIYGSDELDPFAAVFLRSCGGIYGGSSPRSFLEYLRVLDEAGVIDLVRRHLDEPPVLSLNKTVLRRIGGGAQPSWHQDASYLGGDICALNLWMSLSHCGGDTDTMGLDILPKRLFEVAEMGTHDTIHHQAIAQAVVERLGDGIEVVRPEFHPGDGLLFDQFFIHRSDIRPLPTERYAIESWFFGPSKCPSNQVPIVAV